VIAADGTCDADDSESSQMGDCQDNNPDVHPGATDLPADGVDQDCDGTDAGSCYADSDGDGYGLMSAPVAATDGDCTAPGVAPFGTDCDDQDASRNPGAEEVPEDGVDQDCDGVDAVTCYLDADGDGYGDPDAPLVARDGVCDPGVGESTNDDDCDDGNAEVNPLGMAGCPDNDAEGQDLDVGGDVTPSPGGAGEGCSCTLASSRPGRGVGLLLLVTLGVLGWGRRRRRHSGPASTQT